MKKGKIIKIFSLLFVCMAVISGCTTHASESGYTDRQISQTAIPVNGAVGVVSEQSDPKNSLVAYEFTVVNQTGDTLLSLALSPAGQSDWGENLLMTHTFCSGDRVKIKAFLENKEGLWDLKAVNENGLEYIFADLKINIIDTVTLSIVDFIPMAEWTQTHEE